ncbi:MAG: Gfo/Idh/MocA family oxidoreductase [Pirellulaceae bacterium]|nr:Gfo/Idh/MocA family oxidoreductase [Pirellulaceae bacterium]
MYRIGIIGGGRITGMHALAYNDYPKAEMYALCDANEQVARDRSQEWNVQHWYTDYHEMLADEAIDAVEIITPHHLHAEMTVAALEAGKDVSVQKPMALEVAECDAMIDAARRSGKNLRVFENFQHFPPLAKAKQLLDSGAIGDPISLRMKAIQGSLDGGDKSQPTIKRADSRPPYPLPLSHQVENVNPDNWKFDPKQGGGGRMALDYGYHVFGLAVHLMGDVEKVFAWITQQEIVHGWILDSPAVVIWKYRDAERYGSWDIVSSDGILVPTKYWPEDEWVEISGTRGFLWVNRCTSMLLDRPALVMYRDGETTEFSNLDTDCASSFIHGTHDWIDSLEEGRQAALSGEVGRRVLQFCRATQLSSRERREVLLDEVTA